MCAHRVHSNIPGWEVLSSECASCVVQGYVSTSSVFVDSQSSSHSSDRSPSDSEGVDPAIIGASSKRKAAFSPLGSQRLQKVARTDTSHHPGRSVKETEATSRTQNTYESRSTTTSPISRKRRKVLLPQNRETLHSLITPRTSTFTISSLSSYRLILVSS